MCKDCSGKSSRKATSSSLNESNFAPDTIVRSNDVLVQSETMYFDDNGLPEIELEEQYIDDENGEELPF